MYLSKLTLDFGNPAAAKYANDVVRIHGLVESAFDAYRDSSQLPKKMWYIKDDRLIILSDKLPVWKPEKQFLFSSFPEIEDLSPLETALSQGKITEVEYSIKLNAVKRHDGKTSTFLSSPYDLGPWFMNVADRIGLDIDHQPVRAYDGQMEYGLNHKGHQVKIYTVTLTGRALVTDGKLLVDALRQGVGRAKAFGCGLLQIKPLD